LVVLAGVVGYFVWRSQHATAIQPVGVRVLTPAPSAVYRWFPGHGEVTDYETRTISFDSAIRTPERGACSVSASGETTALLPYPVLFTCTLGDQKHQLGGAQVFVRGKSVVIVPQFEPLNGELTARSKESPVVITIPGGTFAAGRYTLHLAGKEQSRQWTVEVR